MKKVTVIGLGSMGSALASCLLDKGYSVCVWNRSSEKAKQFVNTGAVVASSLGGAVEASSFVIVCIKSHHATLELLSPLGEALRGKTVCDLSTGDTADADRLVEMLSAHEAEAMLGMINAYPSGVGQPDCAILTVGSEEAWSACGDIIRTLGGAAAHVGKEPAALAALFAGLFTVRQGFMFGMIYGALACRAAGVPLEVFADQIPGGSIKLVHDYHKLFAETAPTRSFDNPEASMKVYKLAMDDALKTFKSVGAPADFAQLMNDRLTAAVDAGLGDKQLTALIDHIE